MKRLPFIALAAILLTVACKEKDLTEENPPLGKENVLLVSSFLFNQNGLVKDSLYANNLGNRFFIDEVKFLLGDVYIVNSDMDTLRAEKSFGYSRSNTDQLIMRITPGGYSAKCVIQMGLDSLQSAQELTKSHEDGSPFNDPDFRRQAMAGLGYNHLVIKGRVIDSSNPDDTVGTIPFSYAAGTYELSREFSGLPFNFSVNSNMKAKFVLRVDVGPALMNRDLESKPIIVCDPTNAADFNAATEIMDNIVVEIF